MIKEPRQQSGAGWDLCTDAGSAGLSFEKQLPLSPIPTRAPGLCFAPSCPSTACTHSFCSPSHRCTAATFCEQEHQSRAAAVNSRCFTPCQPCVSGGGGAVQISSVAKGRGAALLCLLGTRSPLPAPRSPLLPIICFFIKCRVSFPFTPGLNHVSWCHASLNLSW